MEINREKRLLKQIAAHLADIYTDEMTPCEKNIAELLVEELYLVKEETNIFKSYLSKEHCSVYRVVK